MQDSLVQEVIEFVREELPIGKKTITLETAIVDDLGCDGDDGDEFIEAFGERFDIDMQLFPLGEYFNDEGFFINFPLRLFFLIQAFMLTYVCIFGFIAETFVGLHRFGSLPVMIISAVIAYIPCYLLWKIIPKPAIVVRKIKPLTIADLVEMARTKQSFTYNPSEN